MLDDLSSGVASFVPEGVAFVRGSILDRDLVERTLREHAVEGVIHVAGFKYAGVSVQRPLHTYAQNVEGTRVILEAMAAAGVANIVFSSSAAVFGTPDVPLVVEDTEKRPASPMRVQAHRRVAAARPGRRDGRIRHASRAHLAALLQRRRIRGSDGV